jgi:hypothetical protein
MTGPGGMQGRQRGLRRADRVVHSVRGVKLDRLNGGCPAGRGAGYRQYGGIVPEKTMRAVSQDRLGPPGVLHMVTVPRPEPGGTEVLVRVLAAG